MTKKKSTKRKSKWSRQLLPNPRNSGVFVRLSAGEVEDLKRDATRSKADGNVSLYVRGLIEAARNKGG